jgi:enoyl-CoA hydratase/carnithine racemase
MTMSRVRVEIEDHVARVTLSRPDKMNAVDPEMVSALIDAGAEVDRPDVRAVVLSGEGRAFCAGLDVASFATLAGGDPEAMVMPRTHGDANEYQQVSLVWHRLPVPVIAALHGEVYGAGLQIALGADIRVAAPDARLAVMEMKWGLVPDMGGYALWRGLVRDDVLRELTYTNREFIGEEALQLGLATMLDDDPHARATALAETIANKNPEAIRGAKRLFRVMHEEGEDAILLAESEEQDAIMRQPNQIEAVMAEMQKRAPVFKDV